MNVISLFDYTGIMVEPWADAGFDCWIVDIQHPLYRPKDEGRVHRVRWDLSSQWLPPFDRGQIAAVFAFPPCTDVAVSGARHFKTKGLRALAQSIELLATAQEFCEWSGAPYLIENPVSTFSTYWRKPDHMFHPHEYAGLCEADNYTKKTCLWTGGGFVMPDSIPGDLMPDDRIHKAAPGPDRADFRSATPRGFSRAVFRANSQRRAAA